MKSPGSIIRHVGYMLCCFSAWALSRGSLAAEPSATGDSKYEVGLAKVDVTPEFPIRLSGFSFRKTESEGVRQQIYARAMAIRAGGEPVVLVTVDSIGIPRALRDEVASRLRSKRKLPTERFAICATHSHTTPALAGVLPAMFGAAVPPEHQVRIDHYTRALTDKIEQVSLAALDDLKPSRLTFGIGKAKFAINRRTRGGPVDHDLPVLFVTAPDNKLRGVYVNYACHCVVLSDNKISGDWAGCASNELERRYPDSVALVSIGCGADSNPESGVTGDKGDFAQQYGREIATEVSRLLRGKLAAIDGDIRCKLDTTMLPLQQLPTRDEWAKRSALEGPEGYYASVQLAQLDAGKPLPAEIAYPIQTWKFGNSLAAVFMPGEVVVDYSLRLKNELDADRLWVNAYSNDMPAYIPSERVLKEGGYECGGAMIYYGLPAPFAPGLEDKIISAVGAQLGDEFKKPAKQLGTQGVPPKSPQESLATIKVRDDLRVELVASEPMVEDPVAIDFGPDGKVWIAEMRDYGCTDGEDCPPRGRVTVLEDRDGDGQFETATTFLDKIAMPMSVTVWRSGVLISAAPDILYAEDTTGDGKADKVEKLFTGFSVENNQARVNTLAYGLDGWLYGACMFGGTVRNLRGEEFEIPNTDFRLKPDGGVMEREIGRTQQSRVRDDWGNWFGCDNTVLCYHYPLLDQYVRRNPHVVPPSLSVSIASEQAAKLFPRGNLVLFELSGPPGRATAVCGIGVYRDDVLGEAFNNNLFVCEPVNQLVHRLVPQSKGATFVGERAADESESEFLASTDNWFRPVQARTGPDGALWIVDMYRYVIEHSRWIPKATLDELDIYAGRTMGRIYRVVPKDAPRRPFPRIDKLSGPALAAAMDSPNGWQRDMVQQLILWRGDTAAAGPLEKLANNSKRSATRLQALCTLDLLGKLQDKQIEQALSDAHPAVRRQAVRLAESRLKDSPELLSAVLQLADDSDPFVALQLASSLGETDDPRAVAALANIARRHADDPYVITAVLSSANDARLAALLRVAFSPAKDELPSNVVTSLMELAGAVDDDDTVRTAIDLAVQQAARPGTHRFAALQAVFAGLDRNQHARSELLGNSASLLQELCDKCIETAQNDDAELATRVDCLQVIGRTPQRSVEHVRVLGGFLTPDHDLKLQLAAIDALADGAQDEVAEELLSSWPAFTPSLRSRVLDVLVSRKQWVRALLEAVHSQSLPIAEIDAAHRARLTEFPDDELRKLAATCFAATSSGNRAEVVDRYAKSLPAGDAARGQPLFEKHCATCHEFRGKGAKVGPDIAALKDKTNDGLLREVLDPNRAVDQRYAEYVAITADGRVKSGILVEETSNAITLLGQQGEQTSLLRSELDSLTSTGKSPMPEGFENQVSPQDMADLLKFLSAP